MPAARSRSAFPACTSCPCELFLNREYWREEDESLRQPAEALNPSLHAFLRPKAAACQMPCVSSRRCAAVGDEAAKKGLHSRAHKTSRKVDSCMFALELGPFFAVTASGSTMTKLPYKISYENILGSQFGPAFATC